MRNAKRRNRIHRTLVAAVMVAGGVLGSASHVGAVPPHQHNITNPAGTHNIASGFCNGNFAQGTPQNKALANFHSVIHVGPAGPEGVVTIGGGSC